MHARPTGVPGSGSAHTWPRVGPPSVPSSDRRRRRHHHHHLRRKWRQCQEEDCGGDGEGIWHPVGWVACRPWRTVLLPAATRGALRAARYRSSGIQYLSTLAPLLPLLSLWGANRLLGFRRGREMGGTVGGGVSAERRGGGLLRRGGYSGSTAGATGLFEMRRAGGAEWHSSELKNFFRGWSANGVPFIGWTTSQPILELR
jgi:hypothetical protein